MITDLMKNEIFESCLESGSLIKFDRKIISMMNTNNDKK